MSGYPEKTQQLGPQTDVGYQHQPQIAGGYHQQPQIAGGYQQQPQVAGGYPQQPQIAGGYQQQPQVAGGYPHQPQVAVGYQQQPQMVIIQTAPAEKPSKLENYNGRLSVIFGVVLILLQTLALVLNGLGFWFQLKRDYYDWIGNIAIIMFPAAWGAIFIYISAGFAIGSGKSKNRCVIVAHMVLAIIASVCAFIFVGASCGSIGYDAGELQYRDKWADHASMAVSVLFLIISVTQFIITVWCAVLCCKAACGCCHRNDQQRHPIQIQTVPGVSTAAPPQYQA